MAGVYFEFKLGFVSVQPEILYTRMGAKIADEVEDFRLEYRFDYVQVPVLLKFNIVPAGPIRPFLYGGGYGAYLIKAEGFMEVGENPIRRTSSKTTRDTTTASSAAAVWRSSCPASPSPSRAATTTAWRTSSRTRSRANRSKNRSIMALVGVGF
ncbi:MAG: PorT family protein [Candidatus Moduliflexus flocculans]|nr:PorT family protein [Candidatus Moduliflexus flocculans]